MNISSKEEFDRMVKASDIPVLVDFYSDNCAPCRMSAPLIDEMAEKANGYSVFKVNVDRLPEIAQEYEVMNIPTFAVIKGGREVARHVGLTGKSTLEKLLMS